jgi:disulfide bond formation protein DsbB
MANTRYPALPWPWAALLVVLALLGQEWLLRSFGNAPSFTETAYRTGLAALGATAFALVILPRRRLAYVLGFLVCAGLMAWALWLQHGLGLEPCPLCVFQRVAVIALGVVFLVAAMHNPRPIGAIVYAGLAFVVGAVGAGLAAWHVWIQAQPPGAVASCGMGLNYMLETLPLSEVIGRVLKGSGECAEQGWLFLGLAIPSWTFVFFVAMVASAIALAREE